MGLAELAYASPFYRLLLAGPAPSSLRCAPPAPWPGDKAHGKSIVDGTIRCAGQAVRMAGLDWNAADLTADALDELHGFNWLSDLAALGGDRAAGTARRLIESWIGQHAHWTPAAWSPATLGTRISAWLANAKFVGRGEDDPLWRRMLSSLARQMRHLGRVAGGGPSGIGRFRELRGLVYGAACGIGPARRLDHALHVLLREIKRQVLGDGGHVARSPAGHLEVLEALVDIRTMLLLAQHRPPMDLISAIDRMAPVARFYRHGDGRFALFNDSAEGDGDRINAVLARADAGGRPPDSAAGFERMTAGATVLIADVGAPPPQGFDERAHAGSSSFEMSVGRDRIIVNCGALTGADSGWRRAQRATAAHSTLTVDDTNSSELIDAGGFGRKAAVQSVRESADGAIWITASHDGYAANFGLVHRRRLYLSSDGNDLRGEDSLTGAHRGRFVVRFHLHPDVRASVVQNGLAVLMRAGSGAAWRLQATGGALELTESVYLDGQTRRRTEAVALSGVLDGNGAVVKWAIKRAAGI
ncbi:MAG TPA: heparinase II/III family protein [Alphaproteobacteria bacterium]